jgi:hypothetical protein
MEESVGLDTTALGDEASNLEATQERCILRRLIVENLLYGSAQVLKTNVKCMEEVLFL